jgi:DNA-binding response OmpR family regulator
MELILSNNAGDLMENRMQGSEGMKLLLVEDDPDISENIIDFLERHGNSLDYAMDGDFALELLHENNYDAVILDINLHGLNGFEICKRIRQNMRLKIPVLMLTARVMLGDKVQGFESGADDYLTKPFDLEELLLRLRALTRRYRQCVASVFRVADLTLDPENGLAERDGVRITLPHACFRILLRLMEKYPGIVTREELEFDIWKDQPPMSNSLKSHFYMLRRLVDKPFDKQLLHCIRGRGYKIDDNYAEAASDRCY